MEEDERIKALFQGFKPELPSDNLFLSELGRKMKAVEIVKQHTAAVRRRSRIAVCVAAVAGFVMGVVLTLLMPLIGNLVSTFSFTIPTVGVSTVSIPWQTVSWCVIGITAVITAVNAYEITLSRLTAREQRI